MNKQNILNIIATNLRRLMNEKEMSNAALSRRCDMSAGTISKIINGNMSITIPLAMNVAEGLEVDISELLRGLAREKIEYTPKNIQPKEQLSIAVMSIDSKRVTCVKDHKGRILGQSELEGGLDLAETSGNLFQAIQEAIYSAIDETDENRQKMKSARLNIVMQSYEFEDSKNKFSLFSKRHFHTVNILSDWQISYFSTFSGNERGISLIIDKGVSLSYMENNKLKKLGGWKFPVYDLGGENWLGVEVIRHTIDVFEGYVPKTELAHALLAKFNGKIEKITEACIKGVKNTDIYSLFADTLITRYLMNDPAAIAIIKQGFKYINRSIERIDEIVGSQLPITLNGSLAHLYIPFLDKKRIVGSVKNNEKAELLANITQDYLRQHGIE
jgi:glucosamine kinase